MEIKKLKSVLKSQTALLLVNAAVFGALLELTGSSHSYWWGFFYVGYASYVYTRFLKSGATRPVSLFVTFIVVSLMSALASENGAALGAVSLVSAALIFVFLGGQLFYFSNSKAALSIFYHSVIFGIAAYFSSIAPFNLWWGAIPSLFIIFYVCTRDFFRLETGGYDKRKKNYALAFAFVASQCVWIASLLPFGFLNTGSIILIFSIVVNDLFLAHISGKFSNRVLFRNLAFFGVFMVLIFIAGSL